MRGMADRLPVAAGYHIRCLVFGRHGNLLLLEQAREDMKPDPENRAWSWQRADQGRRPPN